MSCRACEKSYDTNCDMCGEPLVISKKDGDFCCGVDAKQQDRIQQLERAIQTFRDSPISLHKLAMFELLIDQ